MPDASPAAPGWYTTRSTPTSGDPEGYAEDTRDAFPEDEDRQQHDQDRFSRPQQDRQAGGDGGQADQTRGRKPGQG